MTKAEKGTGARVGLIMELKLGKEEARPRGREDVETGRLRGSRIPAELKGRWSVVPNAVNGGGARISRQSSCRHGGVCAMVRAVQVLPDPHLAAVPWHQADARLPFSQCSGSDSTGLLARSVKFHPPRLPVRMWTLSVATEDPLL